MYYGNNAQQTDQYGTQDINQNSIYNTTYNPQIYPANSSESTNNFYSNANQNTSYNNDIILQNSLNKVESTPVSNNQSNAKSKKKN